MPRKILKLEEMVHRKFVKIIKTEKRWGIFLVDRYQLAGEPTPPSSPQADRAGPSSVPNPSGSYDEVLRRLNDLTTYTYEVFA